MVTIVSIVSITIEPVDKSTDENSGQGVATCRSR